MAAGESGKIRPAAAADAHARHVGPGERQVWQGHDPARRIQQPRQRLADRGRVFVQLFFHEVPVAVFADHGTCLHRQAYFTVDRRVAGAKERGPFPRQHHPVAILHVGDAPGQRGQRQAVAAEEHRTFAKAHCQRCAMLRADDQLRVPGE